MMSLDVNESYDGRLARITLGVFTISVGIALGEMWFYILGIGGLVPLISGMVGWCPFCALLKRMPANRFTINLNR